MTRDPADPYLTALESFLVADGPPGLVAAVEHGDSTRTDALGHADADGRVPMRADALIRIQSMTKAVTAVAALLGVQSGDLALDDPVTRWLPELRDAPVLRHPDADVDDVVPAQRIVTVEDLLTCRGGYGMVADDSPIGRAYRERGVEPGPAAHAVGVDAWLSGFVGLPLIHQPGAGWRYHTCFELLGILLSRWASRPLHDHLRAVIFDPLGMPDSGFWAAPGQQHRLPAAYRSQDGSLVEVEPAAGGVHGADPGYDFSHGELLSTAADYLRFARMLRDRGRFEGEQFLRADLVEAMTSDRLDGPEKTPEAFFPGFFDATSWGYGIGVATGGDHPGSFGWDGGYGTHVVIDRDADLIAILLPQLEISEASFAKIGDFDAAAYAWASRS